METEKEFTHSALYFIHKKFHRNSQSPTLLIQENVLDSSNLKYIFNWVEFTFKFINKL